MRIDWVMLIAAVVVILLMLAIQSFVQRQVMDTNARRYSNESVEDGVKLVRQDATV